MHFKSITADDLKSAAHRFHSKVSKGAACWEWQAATKDNGYGYFRISRAMGMISAHKAAWILANGTVPTGCMYATRATTDVAAIQATFG
jgi:hypothetical protein